MTWRKALRDVARLRGGDGLRKTYTFYLRDGGEQLRFEPVICRTDAEAMARAREMLALHSECEAIEVFFGDQQLFRYDRKMAP